LGLHRAQLLDLPFDITHLCGVVEIFSQSEGGKVDLQQLDAVNAFFGRLAQDGEQLRYEEEMAA